MLTQTDETDLQAGSFSSEGLNLISSCVGLSTMPQIPKLERLLLDCFELLDQKALHLQVKIWSAYLKSSR